MSAYVAPRASSSSTSRSRGLSVGRTTCLKGWSALVVRRYRGEHRDDVGVARGAMASSFTHSVGACSRSRRNRVSMGVPCLLQPRNGTALRRTSVAMVASRRSPARSPSPSASRSWASQPGRRPAWRAAVRPSRRPWRRRPPGLPLPAGSCRCRRRGRPRRGTQGLELGLSACRAFWSSASSPRNARSTRRTTRRWSAGASGAAPAAPARRRDRTGQQGQSGGRMRCQNRATGRRDAPSGGSRGRTSWRPTSKPRALWQARWGARRPGLV